MCRPLPARAPKGSELLGYNHSCCRATYRLYDVPAPSEFRRLLCDEREWPSVDTRQSGVSRRGRREPFRDACATRFIDVYTGPSTNQFSLMREFDLDTSGK